MKKNGFTLIELLAVIVILAIIAVITVPKVVTMIDSARQGSAKDAFYGSLKAAELGWAEALQERTDFRETNCESNGKSFDCAPVNGYKMNMEISGSFPESGTIDLDNIGNASVKEETPLVFFGYLCYGNMKDAICIRTDTYEGPPSLSLEISKTTKSITVKANAEAKSGIKTYEFSKDGKTNWTTKTTNTHTFDNLTHNTPFEIYVRVTSNIDKTTTVYGGKIYTNKLEAPTFAANSVPGKNTITITYMSGCGSSYTCSYIKNSNSQTAVSSTTSSVEFTEAGTLSANISDGTNFVSATYNVSVLPPAIETLPIGSYIKYTAGGYSGWRILFNNNGQLDIVSTGSVSDYTLRGNSGYLNAIQNLNAFAGNYVAGYATKARSIGCTSASTPSFSSGSWNMTGNPYEDTLYDTDVNQLKNYGLVQTDKEVWLASRRIEGVTFGTKGQVRTLLTDGNRDYWTLQEYYLTGMQNDREVTKGFRPVVSLSSGLHVVSGDGNSESTAYVLSN